MNGIDKIMERIRQDAQAQQDEARAQTEEQLERIRQDAQAQAEQLRHEQALQGQQAAQRRREQLHSSAGMERRQQLLAEKQSCIDEAFAAAARQLRSLPREEYAQVLARLAAAVGCGREELILSAEDRAELGQAVVEQANALKAGAAFTLSAQTRDLHGGLILKDGNVEYNCSFDTQLRLLRESMAAQVAAILFN